MTDQNSDSVTGGFKARIDGDIKRALLAGEKDRAQVLRGLKSAILYVEVAKGSRDEGLPEDEILTVLAKEAKKRQESADLYKQGGNTEKEAAELSEKAIIEEYLPRQLTESEISGLVDAVIAEQGAVTKETMGRTIAAVKAKSEGAADGGVIARLIKEHLQ